MKKFLKAEDLIMFQILKIKLLVKRLKMIVRIKLVNLHKHVMLQMDYICLMITIGRLIYKFKVINYHKAVAILSSKFKRKKLEEK